MPAVISGWQLVGRPRRAKEGTDTFTEKALAVATDETSVCQID